MEIGFRALSLHIRNQMEEFPSLSPEISSWPSVGRLHQRMGEIFDCFLELVKRNPDHTIENWPNGLNLKSITPEMFSIDLGENSFLEVGSFFKKISIPLPYVPNAGYEALSHSLRYATDKNGTEILGKCEISRIFTTIEDRVSCDYSILSSGSLVGVRLTAYKDRFECLEQREDGLEHDCSNEPLQFLPLNLSTTSDRLPALIPALTAALFLSASIYAVCKFVHSYWNSGQNEDNGNQKDAFTMTELKIV